MKLNGKELPIIEIQGKINRRDFQAGYFLAQNVLRPSLAQSTSWALPHRSGCVRFHDSHLAGVFF